MLWNNRNVLWTMSAFAFFYLLAPWLYRLCKRFWGALALLVVCLAVKGRIGGLIESSLAAFPAEANISEFSAKTPVMTLYCFIFGMAAFAAVRDGVEIEESKGTLAGRDSTDWQVGNTVSAAIGQSDNAFTPVQLATYVATIANNGERLKTHIVDKVTNYERTKTVKSTDVESYGDCGISKKNLDIVRKAMLGVTQNENGTANYMFGDYKVKVAAKTGTAENSGSDHTTFICYAPYEKPEVAIAVVIEHGAKGRYSMQVAKDLLNAYFN